MVVVATPLVTSVAPSADIAVRLRVRISFLCFLSGERLSQAPLYLPKVGRVVCEAIFVWFKI